MDHAAAAADAPLVAGGGSRGKSPFPRYHGAAPAGEIKKGAKWFRGVVWTKGFAGAGRKESGCHCFLSLFFLLSPTQSPKGGKKLESSGAGRKEKKNQ